MTDNNPPFYKFSGNIATTKYLCALMEAVPHQLRIETDSDKNIYKPGPYDQMLRDRAEITEPTFDLPLFDLNDFPDRRVAITDPKFDYDLFHARGYFFSKDVREKFSEEYLNAQYLPIDDSGSCDEVRAKEYMMVYFRSIRPAVDPSSPIYLWEKKMKERKLRMPEYQTLSVIYWDEEFIADVPVFSASGITGVLFTTKEFARQVIGYGFKGIGFQKTEEKDRENIFDPAFDHDSIFLTKDDFL